METGLLLQSLLWGGLLLALLSEVLRPRIQGSANPVLNLKLEGFKPSVQSIVLPALVPIVFGVVLQFYGGFSNAVVMLISFVLPWLLSSVLRLPAVNGLLLLALAWGLPSVFSVQPENISGVNTAILCGLLLYQLLQSMNSLGNENSARDARIVFPAGLWLIGSTWIQLAIPGDDNTVILQATTAIVLIVGAIFRLLPVSNNTALERYGKPIALAVTAGGGICVLGDIALHQPALVRWALLVLGSILAGHFFSMQQEDVEQQPLLHRLLNLAVLGIVMLVASRLYGTLGWVVSAFAIALTHIQKGNLSSTVWQAATLFLVARSLLQVFIYNTNPNVTGINITHPYASVALFIGIALILCARDIHRHLSVAGSMALWVIVALGACYYLHAEATGSLLVAGIFAAAAMTFSPSIISPVSVQGSVTIRQSGTMLVSLVGWLVAYCSLAAPGIELGNSATKTTKLLLLLLPVLVGLLLVKPLSKKTIDEPAS